MPFESLIERVSSRGRTDEVSHQTWTNERMGTPVASSCCMLDITNPSHEPCFAGLNVLVTGGTTGIGRAIALRLVQGGANVYVFGRHEDALQDALAEASRQGSTVTGRLDGSVADQADAVQVGGVFSNLDRHFSHLDVLVNNAAVGSGELMEQSDEAIHYAVQSNLCGYLYCTRQAVARMRPRKAGHIINIGSIVSEKREAGGEVYTATKSAIHGFSESIRKSLQSCGIKVTLIEPGKTGSDLIEIPVSQQKEQEAMLEMLKAEDIAEAVCFCLSQPRRVAITSLQIEPFRHQ